MTCYKYIQITARETRAGLYTPPPVAAASVTTPVQKNLE